MINLLAAICFVLGFLLEILGAKLGVVTPLACALLGLVLFALSGVPFVKAKINE